MKAKPKSKTVPMFISSQGIDTIPKQIDGVWRKIITARVNQTAYQLLCDEQIEVPMDVAEVLSFSFL